MECWRCCMMMVCLFRMDSSVRLQFFKCRVCQKRNYNDNKYPIHMLYTYSRQCIIFIHQHNIQKCAVVLAPYIFSQPQYILYFFFFFFDKYRGERSSIYTQSICMYTEKIFGLGGSMSLHSKVVTLFYHDRSSASAVTEPAKKIAMTTTSSKTCPMRLYRAQWTNICVKLFFIC